MRNGTAEGLNANGGVSDRCVTVELLTGEHFLVSIEVSYNLLSIYYPISNKSWADQQ